MIRDKNKKEHKNSVFVEGKINIRKNRKRENNTRGKIQQRRGRERKSSDQSKERSDKMASN